MQISVKLEEILPVIEEYIREKYGIKKSVPLHYTSKTRFLTFADEERIDE